MQWLTLYKKETAEQWSRSQWIWVPLVFFVLGALDPIVQNFLPQILKNSGDMPEGFTFPTLTHQQVFVASLGEFTSIGLIVFILLNMSMIVSERKSGVLELIMAKPVSYSHYLTSKIASGMTIAIVALLCGFISAGFYTSALFQPVDTESIIYAFFLMVLWYLLILMIVLFLNSFLNSGLIIFFITFVTSLIVSGVSSIFDNQLKWSPGMLPSYASQIIMQGKWNSTISITVIISLCVCVVLGFVSYQIFRNRELLVK